MSVVARTLRRTGSTVLGPPLIALVARLGQRRILGGNSASRAVEELVSHSAHRTTVASIDLGASVVKLELDLSLPSCRSLLVQPLEQYADWSTIRLYTSLARQATTIFDIGANVGVFTYLAASHAPDARIIAYEPTPHLASLIERNVERNGWSPRVEVRRAGVSAEPGTMTFYVRANDQESTLESGRTASGDVRERFDVPVVSLDEVFEREGIAPETALLKIDVEGHEMKLLDGFERTLRRPHGKPKLIMEFLGRAINEGHIIDRVLGLGLNVSYITSRGLVRLGSTADFARAQELDQFNFLVTDWDRTSAPP